MVSIDTYLGYNVVSPSDTSTGTNVADNAMASFRDSQLRAASAPISNIPSTRTSTPVLGISGDAFSAQEDTLGTAGVYLYYYSL